MKFVKWKPRPDVDEASAVEHEIENRGERIMFGLLVEMAVPGDRTAYI